MSDVTTVSNNQGNILQTLCKISAEKKLLFGANVWIGTHAMLPVILKRCCHFSVVQSFHFETTTHLTGKHSRSTDQKYNSHEC